MTDDLETTDPLAPREVPSLTARRAVSLPALLLMIAAMLGLVGSVIWAFAPSPPVDLGEGAAEAEGFVRFALGPGRTMLGIAGIVVNAFIVFGAWRMRSLASRTLGILACVAALVNPVGCCLTFPFGVWGLMVVNDPRVKEGFLSA